MNLRAPALRSELNEPEDDGSARRLLLELYRVGLQAVDGEQRVARALCVDEVPAVAVVSLGKAGAAMLGQASPFMMEAGRTALRAADHLEGLSRRAAGW